MQTTVTRPVNFVGVGLHSGKTATATVLPAPADSGIVFVRTDLPAAVARVPALWSHVVQEPLNTRIRNDHGTTVGTIEHLMAALAGIGIHNALIRIDGPEVPILDGSSAGFVRGLIEGGISSLSAPIRAVRVLKPVEVRDGLAVARLDPSVTLEIDFSIEFADAAIGRQSKTLNMANGTFVRELCDCRTFCRQADVDAMHAAGLALGGSLENAVVVDGDAVLSPGGLRRPDEAVRHKMLDALGDLYTAGAPILGKYTGHRAGHALTNKLLVALFSDPSNYVFNSVDARTSARLPGAGVTARDLAAVA